MSYLGERERLGLRGFVQQGPTHDHLFQAFRSGSRRHDFDLDLEFRTGKARHDQQL